MPDPPELPVQARADAATSFRVHARGIQIQFHGRKLDFSPERFLQFMGLMSEAARQFAAADVTRRAGKQRPERSETAE